MKIAFIGCVQSSFRALQKLVEMKSLDIDVVAVITKNHSRVNSDFVDLRPLCIKHEIPVHFEKKEEKDKSLCFLKNYKPDVIYCFGWSALLPQEVLKVAPLGVIGFHPAPLPKGRGRHPIIWALALGLDFTASTFFRMDEGADTGPLLSQVPILITPDDTASSLYEKILNSCDKQIFDFTLQLASGNYQLKKQDELQSTSWRKRSRSDGKVDWRMRADDIHNLVRALSSPYPGADISYLNDTFILWRTSKSKNLFSDLDEPGKVLGVENNRALIKCGGRSAIWIYDLDFITELTPGDYL